MPDASLFPLFLRRFITDRGPAAAPHRFVFPAPSRHPYWIEWVECPTRAAAEARFAEVWLAGDVVADPSPAKRPLTVEEARALRICRICREPCGHRADLSDWYSIFEGRYEHAHIECVKAEAKRAEAVAASSLPLTVEQARAAKVCRVCGQPCGRLGDPADWYSSIYGRREHAHVVCVQAEAKQAKAVMAEPYVIRAEDF